MNREEIDLEPFQRNINRLYFEISTLTSRDPSQLRVGSEAFSLLNEIGGILQR